MNDGHADVGDDEALAGAQERAEHDADREREDPAVGRVNADRGRVDLVHEHRVRHGDDADDGADRQVDVARDDDRGPCRSR